MRKHWLFILLLVPLIGWGQTTHKVTVAINQGAECPVPLSTENIEKSLVIYPNPTSDFVTIQSDLVWVNIQIYTLSGAIVKKVSLAPNKERLDLKELPDGIYLMEIHADGYSVTHKLKVGR